eukprot:TRINITY_DN2307_c0_g1_i1.p1 TRINITY_DN2307_c0_g1~~TRINITY_DN2307_c0_g1_i1.p1  ORF type:complete len:323 (+),score=67.13 TRINITY_DN2307_c0_g1_i1:112-1080(+)
MLRSLVGSEMCIRDSSKGHPERHHGSRTGSKGHHGHHGHHKSTHPKEIEEQVVCCMAMTADCLACSGKVSVTEYCAMHPSTAGCPKDHLCCKAQTVSCLACSEGMSQEEYCYEHPFVRGCSEETFELGDQIDLIRLACWAIGFLLLLLGLAWGYLERKKRRSLADRPSRTGSYTTRLFAVLRHPSRWIPTFLFTPVLAAFNRAEADDRECTACDVCFGLLKPVSQYTTRQTIRGKYGLKDENCSDFCTALCCTPCAVAQDAMELELLGSANQHLVMETSAVAPGIPVATGAAVPVGYSRVQVLEDRSKMQLETVEKQEESQV